MVLPGKLHTVYGRGLVRTTPRYKVRLRLELTCRAENEGDNLLDATSRYAELYTELDLPFAPYEGLVIHLHRVPANQEAEVTAVRDPVPVHVSPIVRLTRVVYTIAEDLFVATASEEFDDCSLLRRAADRYVDMYGMRLWYSDHLAQALCTAIDRDDMQQFRALVEAYGHSPQVSGRTGISCLLYAARRRQPKAVQLLLNLGLDPNSHLEVGLAPLGEAAAQGCEEIVSLLLTAGAEPNARTASGLTPLICAAIQGSTEVVRLLAAAGADIQAPGPRGKTALMRAAESGHTIVVKQLLQLGADPTRTDVEGNTALNLASMNGHQEVVGALTEGREQLQAGMQVQEQDA